MFEVTDGARFGVVTETRGDLLRQRRLRHGMSVSQLHRASKISRDAIDAAEGGKASDLTYSKLEKWFDDFEEETGAEGEEERATPAQAPTVVIRLGNGAVVVEGPVDNLEALIEAAERLR